MLQTIEKTEKKNVYHYDCGITIQHVHGLPYTNGKDDIHITINGTSSTNGANWGDSITLPNSTLTLLQTLGARATKKHIYYGKCRVPKNSSLSKLKDYMALAELLEVELKNLFKNFGSHPFTMEDCDETGYPTKEYMNYLDNSKNNSIFVNS